MKARTKNSDIEQYLREELLALLPHYRDGFSGTLIFTLKDRHQDPRGVPWLVEKLASYYSLDLLELRRRCGEILGLKHHISLPLSENLVLLPVKARQFALPGETATGYINLLQVERILPPPAKHAAAPPPKGAAEEKAPWLSRVLFKCGLTLKTLNTPETLKERLRQGEAVREDFLRRRSQGITFAGLSRKALLEQLPGCDCLLKDIFIEIFGLKEE